MQDVQSLQMGGKLMATLAAQGPAAGLPSSPTATPLIEYSPGLSNLVCHLGDCGVSSWVASFWPWASVISTVIDLASREPLMSMVIGSLALARSGVTTRLQTAGLMRSTTLDPRAMLPQPLGMTISYCFQSFWTGTMNTGSASLPAHSMFRATLTWSWDLNSIQGSTVPTGRVVSTHSAVFICSMKGS